MIDAEDYAKKVSQALSRPGEVAAAMAGIGFFPLHEINRLFGSANGAEVIEVNGRKFYRRPAEEEILARSLSALGFEHVHKSLFRRGDIDVKIISSAKIRISFFAPDQSEHLFIAERTPTVLWAAIKNAGS